MLIGTVEEVGPESPLGLRGRRPGRHPGLADADPAGHRGRAGRAGTAAASRCPCDGYADPVRPLHRRACCPTTSPPELALAVMDVCGAPALTARVVAAVRTHAAPTVAVVGGAGKSGSLSLAAARDAGAGRTIGVVPAPRRRPTCSTAAGLADEVVVADARDPVALRAAVAGRRRARPTSPSSASTCPAARAARSWPPPRAAPSSSSPWPPPSPPPRWAPRGWPPTCTMLVGNGYVPGHADARPRAAARDAGVRGLFERTTADGTHDRGHARRSSLDPAVVAQGPRPGPQGRPPDRRRSPSSTPPCRSSAPRCGWPASPAPTPTARPWVNRLVDAVRADVGLEHGVALPGLGRAAARRGRRPARPSPRRPPPARCASGCPRARTPRRATAAVPQGRRRRRHAASTRAARERERLITRGRRRPAQAVDLPHRRDRRHLRGHPAGAGGRPRGRRRHRGDPLDRAVAARLRARGRDPRGLRRHLRHAGELPADAGGPRRDQHASSAATSG